MLSSKSQQWLKGRTTSGDLKISMPRSQPRNSNSISLGRSSRHQYIWKNPQGDSSGRPRGIIKSQFSPWYCQMRGELWAGVFLNPSHLLLLRADPEIQHSDPKQEQSPPGSSLGPASNKLGDLLENSSLGSRFSLLWAEVNREQLPGEMRFQEEDTSLNSDAPKQWVCWGQPDILMAERNEGD